MFNYFLKTISLLVLVLLFATCINGDLLNLKEIKRIAKSNDQDHFDDVLKGILKPRIAGTKNHEKVKNFIITELENLDMNVELDTFIDKPPGFKNLTFTNIIGRLNPNADKYLTLSCHYDSKYYREHNFVGATDSAVPCAIILNVIKTLKPFLTSVKDNLKLSLMVIFFDGEEAFREWNQYDSLYGSRHLAQKWENQIFRKSDCSAARELDRIDTLVLLDLIGGASPKFYNYFQNTYNMHKRIYDIERTLSSNRMLNTRNLMFLDRDGFTQIDDDHKPFLKRGINVLHLIPTPFPKHWHKPEDNETNLNFNSIRDFTKIFRAFVYEHLMAAPQQTILNKC